MTTNPSLRETLAVLKADDAQPSQRFMLNGHERAHAELDYAKAVLRLANRRIADLCATVNILAGNPRKVRAEDYAQEVRAALTLLDTEDPAETTRRDPADLEDPGESTHRDPADLEDPGESTDRDPAELSEPPPRSPDDVYLILLRSDVRVGDIWTASVRGRFDSLDLARAFVSDFRTPGFIYRAVPIPSPKGYQITQTWGSI